VIFIASRNRACEKTILPLKSPIGGFILRSWPQNSTAELNPRSRGPFGDQIRRSTKPPIKIPKRNRPKISHSAVSIRRPGRRLNRRIKPENNKCIRSIRRFRFGGLTADRNRRSVPELSGIKRRFHSAVSGRRSNRRFTNDGETKGEAKGILRRRSSRKTKHIIVRARTFPNIFGKRITRHNQTHNKI